MMQRLNSLNNGYVGGSPEVPTCSISCGIITPKKLHINALEINQWERPDYWLQLPQINEGDQKMAGLFAVFKGASGNTGATADSNFVSLRVEGNYIVDWGNGITKAFPALTTAAYTYNFENIDASTETPDGYRQVIIQVYPQAGATLTRLELNAVTGLCFSNNLTGLSGLTLPANTVYEWLDIKIAGASLSSLGLFSACAHLHKFEYVGSSSIGSLPFQNCKSLERVVGTKFTSNVTNMATAFQNCSSLRTLPLLDTRKATNWFATFSGCLSLHTVPCFDLSKADTTYQMFRTCANLNDAPKFNLSKVTNAISMFENCKQLESIPMYDLSSKPQMNSMMSGSGIKKFPMLNTSGITNMGGLFLNCTRLKEIPKLDTSSNTDFGNFIAGSGIEVFDLDTSKARSYGSFARLATCLKKLPILNFSGATGLIGTVPPFQEMFFRCRPLTQIPDWDLSAVNWGSTGLAGTTYPFYTFFSDQLQSIRVLGLKGLQRSMDLSNAQLSPTELNRLFTNLGGVTTYGGCILNITNVWGATTGTGWGVTADRSIATNKGWTIIG